MTLHSKAFSNSIPHPVPLSGSVLPPAGFRSQSFYVKRLNILNSAFSERNLPEVEAKEFEKCRHSAYQVTLKANISCRILPAITRVPQVAAFIHFHVDQLLYFVGDLEESELHIRCRHWISFSLANPVPQPTEFKSPLCSPHVVITMTFCSRCVSCEV